MSCFFDYVMLSLFCRLCKYYLVILFQFACLNALPILTPTKSMLINQDRSIGWRQF